MVVCGGGGSKGVSWRLANGPKSGRSIHVRARKDAGQRDLNGHVGLTRCGRIVGGRHDDVCVFFGGDGISSRGFFVVCGGRDERDCIVGNRCEHAELDDLVQMLR